jgi:hypothetical protein
MKHEDRFIEDIQAFVLAVPGFVKKQQREDLARAIGEYDGSATPGDDPLRALDGCEARAILVTQRDVAPELAEHPFFRKVAEIAQNRWSQGMQELIDADNYRIQKDIGANPSIVPRQEVIKILDEAASTAARYASPEYIRRTFALRGSIVHSVKPSASQLSAFVHAVKRNW